MDEEHFDRLVARFVAFHQRRSVLGLLGTSLLASLGSLLAAPDRAPAKRRHRPGQRPRLHASAKRIKLGRPCNASKPSQCVTGSCETVRPDKGEAFRCGGTTPSDQDVCCAGELRPCLNDCQCCGALRCTHREIQPPHRGWCEEVCQELGQACTATNECCLDDAVCDVVRRKPDNSCLIDGNQPEPRLCCRGVGSFCTGSCQCCGALTCRMLNQNEGECVGESGAPPSPPPGCVDLNVACNARDVCCSDPFIVCTGVDAQKGTTRCDAVGLGVAQCCHSLGGVCSTHCQCCGALRCQNGRCDVPPDICHPVGESCADGEPCCAGAGVCFGGRCCEGDGVTCPTVCATDAPCQACCAGYCRVDGKCGPKAGCVDYGGNCTASAECCNQVPCTGPIGGGQKSCRYP